MIGQSPPAKRATDRGNDMEIWLAQKHLWGNEWRKLFQAPTCSSVCKFSPSTEAASA